MTAPTAVTESIGIDRANDALRTHFGYPAFRAGQLRAIESVLAGRDTLVVLPTGGGKSLCFQVPALVLPRLTVVISPLISLMKDQVDALTVRGLPATFINSTLSSAEVSDRLNRAISGEVKLLYLAPERFDVGTTAERLGESGVSLLAVDEAHCISQWGHDFRPAYLRIAEVRRRLGWPTTIALTATATPQVRSDITHQLRLDSPATIITGFDRKNLRYWVVSAATEVVKDQALVRLLRDRTGIAVVYASTRRTVERVAGVLLDAGIPSAAYHAGLDDVRRYRVQNDFMGERIRAIVATNAFGMGIDKPNVRLVIHHAMPGTLEAYYQEAGRAGRDGLPADCFLVHAAPDRLTHEFFIAGAHPRRQVVEAVYGSLQEGAASSGRVWTDASAIAGALAVKTTAREVESARRVQRMAGALLDEKEPGSSIRIRLLATPERIRRELGDDISLELGLLRAVWRAAGEALHEGAVIDLNCLPPGIRSPLRAQRLLDSLQSRQFVHWERAEPGTRLADRRRPLGTFKIDWTAMGERRQADVAKLDAMQQYANLKGCRRSFVLRYFGDPAARDSCGGCDNCLRVQADAKTLAD